MKKILLLYGAVAGVCLTVYVNALDATNIIYRTTWGAYLGYLAILILPVCIFFAMNELNRKQLKMTFWQSLTTAILIALIAATVYSAYTFIDIRFFDAAHLQHLFSYTSDEMRKTGSTSAEVDAAIDRMKAHYFSWKPYRNTYIWYLGMGIFYGLLFHIVFLFRNRKNNHN